MTPVERRKFSSAGQAVTTHGTYPAAMRALGTETDVAVIDLAKKSLDLWNELGAEETLTYFMHLAPGESANYPEGEVDNTHFQAKGAIEVARMVATALGEQAILPAGDYLKDLDAAISTSSVVWPAKRPVSG